MTKAAPYLFCLLGFLLLPLVQAPAQDWEVVNYGGRDYVTLRSFCGFYGFDYNLVAGGTNFSAKNKSYDFRIPHGDAREVFINGVRYWLSFPITQNDRDWLISRIDVVNLFEPILRPHRIADRYSVRGVVIDPGHGGADNGATSHIGTYEKNYALDTAFRLEKVLQADGLDTVITRRSDIFIPLEERVNIASRYHDYIFISIHYNYANRSAHGLETYTMTPRGAGSTDEDGHVRLSDYQRLPGNEHDVFNVLLGHEIHRQIIQLNPNDSEADRGLKRARFVVLKDNPLPAVLVEGGFLTNRMEATVVDRPSYREALAEAIGKGVENFIQVMRSDLPLSPMIAEVTPPNPRLKLPPVVAPVPTPATRPTPTAEASSPTQPTKVTTHATPVPGEEPTVTIYPVSPPAAPPPASATTPTISTTPPPPEKSEPSTSPTIP